MSSNETNTTDDFSFEHEYLKWISVYTSIEILFAVVGTLLNLWFLVAILISRDMRSRLRNKIICNILVVHLLDSAFIVPANVGAAMGTWSLGCGFYSAIDNLQLMQDFIVNWLLVMVLVVFIAQIQDFNPRTRLTPKAATLGTVGLLVLPWVASLMVVPVIVHQYNPSSASTGCFVSTVDSFQIFKSIDTAVPILLAVLLVIAAAVLRSRRFTSDSMRAELITRVSEVDNIFAYVAVAVVSAICDFLRLVTSLDTHGFYHYDFMTVLYVFIISAIMTDARVVLTPLAWLLLPDVRQRIKNWRPWSRLTADLTVAYRKEENSV